MKFFRSKAVIILVILMSFACITSLVIAIRTTITIVEKKEQAVKPASALKTGHEDTKRVSVKDMAELPLYFNGVKVVDYPAYLFDKKYYFLPVDEILKKIGSRYSYYNSDDKLQTNINGIKIVLRLGEDKFNIGGKEIAVSNSPLSLDDHILVPSDLISKVEGFNAEFTADIKVAFLDYFPGLMDKTNEKINLIRFNNGMLNISDIFAQKSIFESKDSLEKLEHIEASKDKTAYLLKSNKNVYIIISANGKISSKSIIADLSATFSQDGKYVYWVDKNKKTSFIYEISSGKTRELGDYYFRINNIAAGNPEDIGMVLDDYKEDGKYKRISLTNVDHLKMYTFVERNGKSVIEGTTVSSPDRKKLLYHKNGNCYLVNNDGTEMVLLGQTEGNEFKWISNNKIFMLSHSDNNMFVFTRNGRTKTKVDVEWKKLGQTQNGVVFFTKGNSLFRESDGIENKITDLPFKIDYIYTLNASGPYIVATDLSGDGVFYINNGKIEKIGKSTSLLNTLENGEIKIDFDKSISSFSGGNNIVILQKENGFLSLNIVNTKTGVKKNLVVNYPTKDQSEIDSLKTGWISKDRIIIYTPSKGWIIDFNDEVKIFEWSENAGSIIKDVLLRP